jgi:pimeloyl-ACP methyl ester carboxylesterase
VVDELEVRVPAGRIHAERRGGGAATTIAIPGLSANLRGFDYIAERIAGPDRQLIALDLRGRGKSDVTPAGTYGWDAHARDVVAVADALGVRSFSLLGQSMGAAIAMEVARMAPDRLTHVVLIDAAGAPDPSTAPPIMAAAERLGAVLPSTEAYIALVQKLGTIKPWSPYWERYFQYELAPVEGGVRARSDRAAVLEDAAYGAAHDPQKLWPYLVMPTLLLRATQPLVEPAGFIVPASVRDAFRRDVPTGTVVEVDANHYGINTHPDSVAAINEFLAR